MHANQQTLSANVVLPKFVEDDSIEFSRLQSVFSETAHSQFLSRQGQILHSARAILERPRKKSRIFLDSWGLNRRFDHKQD